MADVPGGHTEAGKHASHRHTDCLCWELVKPECSSDTLSVGETHKSRWARQHVWRTLMPKKDYTDTRTLIAISKNTEVTFQTYLFWLSFRNTFFHVRFWNFPDDLCRNQGLKYQAKSLSNPSKCLCCTWTRGCFYLVLPDRHIFHAKLIDGLPCPHIQHVPLFAQQQRGVVKHPRLRELHHIHIWTWTHTCIRRLANKPPQTQMNQRCDYFDIQRECQRPIQLSCFALSLYCLLLLSIEKTTSV